MDYVRFLPLVFICFVLTIQSSARYTASFSSPVIARDRHRLKDFTFKSFHSVSLVWCGLSCQRHPRCVSTNFRKVYNVDDLKGVCELNERAALSPIGETEALEYKEEMIYTQFEDVKHDCQLTSCMNGGLCTFAEALKAFNCKCDETLRGNYCEDTYDR